MSGRILASAPGKVLLCGEYAVLDGAPAISMAVDRRARVEVERIDGETFVIAAPGYADGDAQFRVGEDGAPAWQGDASAVRHALFEAIWQSASVPRDPALSFTLDTRELFDPASGVKLGLGSSAALAVALATSLAAVAGGGDRVEALAADAHRRFQHGKGSGVDVATSYAGGIIEYRQRDGCDRRPLAWPDGLQYAILWSGQPSDTSAKLSAIDPGNPAGYLADAATAVAARWRDVDAPGLLDAFRSYVASLRRFDVDRHLGIFDAGHGEMTEHAAAIGAVYKPCGSGGGDVGIVLSDDAGAVAALSEQAEKLGFRRLDISLDSAGADVTGRERI